IDGRARVARLLRAAGRPVGARIADVGVERVVVAVLVADAAAAAGDERDEGGDERRDGRRGEEPADPRPFEGGAAHSAASWCRLAPILATPWCRDRRGANSPSPRIAV